MFGVDSDLMNEFEKLGFVKGSVVATFQPIFRDSPEFLKADWTSENNKQYVNEVVAQLHGIKSGTNRLTLSSALLEQVEEAQRKGLDLMYKHEVKQEVVHAERKLEFAKERASRAEQEPADNFINFVI